MAINPKISRIRPAAIFLLLSSYAQAADQLKQQLQPFNLAIEEIWKPTKEARVRKGGRYLMSFATNGSGVLLERGNLFDIATNQPILAKALPSLSDAEFTSDGVLLAVVGDQLGYVLRGRVKLGLKLPAKNFRLSRADGDVIYLFGKVDNTHWAVYKYIKGGAYLKYIETQEAIEGVAEGNGGLYFVIRNSIYHAVPGAPLALAFVNPNIKKIDSLGYDSVHKALYFSCEKGLYLLRESRLARLVQDIRGEIKMGDRLYLRDSVTGKIYGVSPL